MLQSHSGFQPLKVCVVGKSYPPEFYSWIENSRLRNLFEKIAIETEEDFQHLIKKLKEFNVQVIRPNVWNNFTKKIPIGYRIPGPYSMTPRDRFCMIGNTLYNFDLIWHLIKSSGKPEIGTFLLSEKKYNEIKGTDWPFYNELIENLDNIPVDVYNELQNNFSINPYDVKNYHWLNQIGMITNFFEPILDYCKNNNTKIISINELPELSYFAPNGIIRLGKDLLFGTSDSVNPLNFKNLADHFSNYNVKTVKSDGHVDGVLCPVKPGLLLSIEDIDLYEYNKTFPSWEVCYLENESWYKVDDFVKLKQKNQGKWWIKGYETDHELIDFVETWLKDWVGYVEETVFDVNALVVDEKNIIVSGYNKKAFDAFERHGITPHIVPFRHRYFWDGGIHCCTLDLHREGDCLNYF